MNVRFSGWQRPDGYLVAISGVVLLLGLSFIVGYVFLAAYPGFDFNASNTGLQVIRVDSCESHPGWCRANPGRVEVGDEITAIGDLSVAEYWSDWRIVPFAHARPEIPISITLLRDGRPLEVSWLIPPVDIVDRLQRLASLFFFAPFWLVGTLVLLFLHPRDRRWALLVAFNYLTAIWLVTGLLSPFRIAASSLFLHILTWFLMPVCLHLHLSVPTPVEKRRTRTLVVVLYGAAAVLSVLEIVPLVPRRAYLLGLLVAVVGSLAILIGRLVRPDPSWRRPVLRLMLAGIGLAFGPIISLSISSQLFADLVPNALVTDLTLLAIPILPVFYAYALNKHRLGDLEFRANRLLSWYTFGFLFVTTFVLGYGLVTWMVAVLGQGVLFVVMLVITGLFVFGFSVLGNRFQKLFDRLAYGVRYNPEELVRLFARRIPATLERKEMIALIIEEMMPSLFVRQSAIYVREAGEVNRFYAQNVTAAEAPATVAELERLLALAVPGRYRPEPIRLQNEPGSWQAFDWVRLAIPLETRQHAVGIWLFGRRDPDDYYPRQDIDLLTTLASQIAPVLENVHLFEEKTTQLRLAHTLQQVGALLTASLSLEEVFARIFDLLAEVVDYDSVSVQLYDTNTGEMRLASGRGFPDYEGARECIRSLSDYTQRVRWRDRPVVVIPDTYADERWRICPATAYIRSWIGASMQVKGQPLGILNVDSGTAHQYNETDGATVAAFANQAAIAIENARLHQETEERAQELGILQRVALATATLVDVDELIAQTTEMIADHLPYDCFGFLTVEEWSGRLFPHPSYHGVTDAFLDAAISLKGSLAGQVVQTGNPVLVPDVDEEPSYQMFLPQVRSLVSVPVMVRHQVVGVLDALAFRKNAFSPDDLRFLTTLAGQLGAAIERSQLYETLQRDADRLSDKVLEQTAALRTERDRTQAILDNAGEGIFLASPTGIVLYANHSSAQLTGWDATDVLGQELLTWLGDEVPDHEREQVQIAIDRGRGWNGEIVGKRKDGGLFEVNLTLVPIHDTKEGLSGFVGVQADISRLKQVERLRTELVSNVSHELRTPLTNIRTYTSLLQRGTEEKRERYLEVLRAETERLSVLIQDLLEVSQLGAIQTELRPTALRPLVEDVVQEAVLRARQKGVTLSYDVPAGLPVIRADASQLDRALANLLRNAITYTPAGGQVTVTAGLQTLTDRKMVWIGVADTGPGIAPEDLPHIFDRFYRGHNARNGGVPGTGLGLAICKEVVIRHDGQISVDNRPGQGATFTIWLPAGSGEGA